MQENTGELNIYNPDKQISEQITLKTIVMHDKAMKLARTGVPEEPTEKPLTFNQRMTLRFKGLNEIISAQQCLVNNSRPIVRTNCETDWQKKYKEDEFRINNPFKDEDNDFNELLAILDFLDKCEQMIITARRTKRFDDDFVWEKQDKDGEVILELTPNFFSMMKELEESYDCIYGIMLKNKIVSSGFSIDEELADKKVEEECLRRIVES